MGLPIPLASQPRPGLDLAGSGDLRSGLFRILREAVRHFPQAALYLRLQPAVLLLLELAGQQSYQELFTSVGRRCLLQSHPPRGLQFSDIHLGKRGDLALERFGQERICRILLCEIDFHSDNKDLSFPDTEVIQGEWGHQTVKGFRRNGRFSGPIRSLTPKSQSMSGLA